MQGSRIIRAIADGRDEILDKLPRLADAAAANPIRQVSTELHGAARTVTGADADGVWSARRDSGHWAVTAQHSTPDPLVGRGNAGFLAARAHYTTRAQRQLHADPRAAAEIGREFRYDLHQAYLRTHTTRAHRSPEKAADVERKARYETARGWIAVTEGFRMDLVVRSALGTARAKVARRQPVTTPLSAGEGTDSSDHSGFVEALKKLLHEHADKFWEQTLPGGRYAAFHTEHLRAGGIDEQVRQTWYNDFERAMQTGGRAPGQYRSKDEFFDFLEDRGNNGLLDALSGQVDTAVTLVGPFHYADPSLSSASKQQLLQHSIPALAERAMLPKAAFQRIHGPFSIALSAQDPNLDTLRTTARAALNLTPGDPVRALEPAGHTSLGHCPAPNLTASDNTSATTAILELAALVAPETLWRAH
ncbi:hypothetical protein ACPESR_28985 [Nocardia testacea]|uniref:hypothetical protein n=1 Tax=Nocardia testacea TaxID=248551 RepID=UPI003C2C537D